MARDVRQIRIESILGGHSPTTHFAAPDQFRSSIGIDPALPINDSTSDATSLVASGLLRPSGVTELGQTNRTPSWIIEAPSKNTTLPVFYVYDSGGSVYTINQSLTTLAGLGDLTDGGTSSGNGAAYYDNYVYFSRDTTIARYGPLDGTSTFTDDYWAGTLGLTALTKTTYPVVGANPLPDHVLHRHSDGKLYITDVVDNRGTIHCISTTKTTVEGDTNNGSTYNTVQVGYGLWPTAIESYGDILVIALVETNGTALGSTTAPRAKLAFWDTTSQNINQITWGEFADPVISALKNINGVLYATSSRLGTGFSDGFRISRYVGGYTFQDVLYSETGRPGSSGAVDGDSSRLLAGTKVGVPDSGIGSGVGSVISYGLQKSGIAPPGSIFNIMSATRGGGSIVSAIKIPAQGSLGKNLPIIGYSLGGANAGYIGVPGTTYNTSVSLMWWSQLYRIGQPFKITKIRIPLAQAIANNMIVTPKIYTDDGNGTTHTLATINNTSFSGKRNIVIRPENLTGDHNFWLELKWTGSALCTVGLPITIEYELIDD